MNKLITAALAAAALSGCTLMGFDVPRSNFGCSGMPEGVKCMSAQEVFEATENSDHVNGEVAKQYRAEQGKEPGAASNKNAGAAAPQLQQATPTADKPQPVRHPAKVMRVWINSFEDDDGDLYAGQYVFTEIEPRRWSVGSERGKDSTSMNPLNTGSGSGKFLRGAANPLN